MFHGASDHKSTGIPLIHRRVQKPSQKPWGGADLIFESYVQGRTRSIRARLVRTEKEVRCEPGTQNLAGNIYAWSRRRSATGSTFTVQCGRKGSEERRVLLRTRFGGCAKSAKACQIDGETYLDLILRKSAAGRGAQTQATPDLYEVTSPGKIPRNS
ncbi:hypothetical protein PLEOSDRAFT_171727 [Pleurotus ostreatus PC15]|uniref:Uncharacterized protein n=1 Tax=Pleurotus ostreatus (strain PC15) TaxID=1137138 RepID=A0A067N5V0_PLEO1|nr:hypothetical protein PLEOSDRAFT_171727 [Pleurotus ostreatus PC15]